MSSDERVHLGLLPGEQGSDVVLVVVKRTFRIEGARLVRTDPSPFRPANVDSEYRNAFVRGTDFAVEKIATDVIVLGSAFAPRGETAREVTASVSVGCVRKRVRVVGNRVVERRRGVLVLGDPAPFESMPIAWTNAYGGVDRRVPNPPPTSAYEIAVQRVRGPRFYPRNPHGRGYFATGEALEGTVLPNLEDADDPLDLDRMVVGDPRDWWKAPIPWCLDWMPPWFFPRAVYGGSDAWFPGPEDRSMPEVASGWLPSGYRTARQASRGSWFNQDASHGLTLRDVVPGSRIALEHMNDASRLLAFEVPSMPAIEVLHGGVGSATPVRLHHVVCHPKRACVDFVYASHATIGKRYAPGFHARIPVAARIDARDIVRYDAPTPIPETVRAATERSAAAAFRRPVRMLRDAG